MYDVFKQKLAYLLEQRMETGELSETSDVYFFGINDSCQESIVYLRSKGISVKGILENNPVRQGIFCCGVKSMSVREGIGMDPVGKTVLISSPYWREMRSQLLALGVPKKNIIVLFVFFDEVRWKPYFRSRIDVVYRGRDVYRSILKEYSSTHKLLLCPYTGTGDIYLIGTLLPQYLRKNHLEKYVLVVISASCRKVAKIFGIENIYQLENMEDCTNLVQYYMLCPEECPLEILNDSWADVYTNPTQWIRGLHGMNFTQMFTRFVFRLGAEAQPEQPVLKNMEDEVGKVFEKYGLKEKRTVILAPYTTTLAELPDEFWENIVEELKFRGYAVYTNSSGEREPAVKGTEPVFFSLEIAPQVLSRAGGFIGIRSGFCDVISASTAKKVILYDKFQFFYNCSAYDYFSLEKMGLCEDAVEIQYDNHKYLEMLPDVLREFPG